MISLRPYQFDIVSEIRNQIRLGLTRILAVSPTGSGKTVMFSYIAKGASSKSNKVLVLSHRMELLTQAGGSFERVGLSPVLITAATNTPPDGEVFCGMTTTIKNRMEKPEWQEWWKSIHILIVDEAHRSEFYWLLKHESGKIKLGFTATAKRVGKMPQLSDEYDTIVNKVDVQELINLGYLLPDRYYGIPVDIKGVRKDQGGEYNSNQLYEKFKVFKGLAKNLNAIAPNEQTIIFCINIRHCVDTALALTQAGISAKFVTSEYPKPAENSKKEVDYNFFWANFETLSGDRDEIIKQWKARKFDVLINAGILVEGFDAPSTSCVVINLATTSQNKWLQMIGRGSRISDGKQFFKLLDFGGNATRLGHYRSERSFSLTHKTSDGNGVVPSKECPKCHSLVMVSSRVCKYCGHTFPTKEEQREVELQEMQWNDPLELEAAINNRSKAWVWRQIYIRGGEPALREYAAKNNYHRFWVKKMVAMYGKTSKI